MLHIVGNISKEVATIHCEHKLGSSYRRLYEGVNTNNGLTALYCYNNEPRYVLYCKDKHDRILSIAIFRQAIPNNSDDFLSP